MSMNAQPMPNPQAIDLSSIDSPASDTAAAEPHTLTLQATEPPLMQPDEALHILQKLIAGINPLSDEPLAAKHLYLDSDIHRALQAAIPALAARSRWLQRQAQLPTNAGKPWTTEEEQALSADYASGDSIEVLTQRHQRTKGSITSRLEKLGKLRP